MYGKKGKKKNKIKWRGVSAQEPREGSTKEMT